MASAINYTAAGTAYNIEADTDTAFDDDAYLEFKQALDLHDHSATRGLAVARLAASVAGSPTFTGVVAFGSSASVASSLVVGNGLTVSAGGMIVTGGANITGAIITSTTINAQTISAVANFTGSVTVANSLVVSAGGFAATGASTITGTLGGITTLTTSGAINGQTISAAASFTGSVTVANSLVVSAGGFAATGLATLNTGLTLTGTLTMATAASKIVPGATSLSLRNNADSADNFIVTNAGAATVRSTLAVGGQTTFNTTGNVWTTASAGTLAAYGTFVSTGGTMYVGMDSSPNTLFGVGNYGAGIQVPVNFVLKVNAGTTAMTVPTTGVVSFPAGLGNAWIGDTSNANQTLGLTINQGGAQDEALALKASDVAHGVTTLTETDTWLSVLKAGGPNGGATLRAFSDGGTAQALVLDGVAAASDTTKSAAGLGPVIVVARKASGTGTASVGASGNLMAILDGTSTRFIFQQDGSAYEDVGTAFTNYDAHDDVALLTEISRAVGCADDPIHAAFRDWADVDRDRLQAMDLVHFNSDGHHFANRSRIQMLLIGAVRQLGGKVDAQARTIAGLEARLALGGA